MHRLTRKLFDGSVLVSLLGLVFIVGGVVLWIGTLASAAESGQHALFELVMHTFFGGVILVIGIHLEHSELPIEERRAVLVWCYAGFLLMFALSLWGHIASILDGHLSTAFVSDFLVFTSIGGAFGAIAGANWGRATSNRLLAEQNREQREMLGLLTRLVSHDIRNDMMIVDGHVNYLARNVHEDARSNVEVIQTRTSETIRLLEDIGTLVKSLGEEQDLEPIDLSQVLRLEAASIRQEFPDVEVETDIESGLRVRANNLINQLFSNLLRNAVRHNDFEDLRVSVSASRSDDLVDVHVGDNGKGIPPEKREECFELGEQGDDSEGEGIGLYLVSRLVELYDGAIEIRESPSGGALFAITLPVVAGDEA